MQKSETGRSILEILSVLVIMILIVWGGLRLWNEASFDSQGHALGERLFAIRDSRRLSMNTHSNKKMLRTEVGPHSSKITIENGIGPQNKDWFWISVNIANSSLCSFLTEYDIDAGFVNDDCETSNEVTFYFLKFPENASSDTPNKDNQPKECPENMICNDNFEPIGCKENYFLHNGNCTQCPENNSICENGTFECKDGYYKDGIRCRSCGANVLSCDEDGNPTECKVKYYLSGNLCIACPTTGVATCEDDGFTCQAGYYKNGNSCTSCGTGVVTCDEDGNPTECEDGYYLSGNSCVQCPTTGVDTCDTNGFTCLAGYYKNGNTCVFCAQFDQYSIGGSVTACSVCEIGKKANDQHSACVNCQVGEKCACDAGLLWNGTACACPENSSITVRNGYQITGSSCYCNEGYELNGDKTGCIKISPCKGDMCCQNLFDVGFEVDTTCSSSVYNCSTQKDNTFFMYKPSSGVPYPIYKGDMTVNKDLSAPTCGLLVRAGHFTANANIELKGLTSYGLTLAAGKTITAEDVGINDGEILIESGATLNAELSAYSSSETTTTLINRGTIKDVYQFPTYVENYGEIYGDGVYSNGKELINKGTLHAEGLEFEKIENSGTIILSYVSNYNDAGLCPNNAGILNNSGTIETASCIDTAQFQQNAGSVITPGLYIGSNSENKDNPLVMSGGKLVVDNLYIFGDKNGPRLSGNSELIINSDYENDDFTGIDLYISDNAMMQISPSDSSLALRKFKMTGGVLKVPLLQIWGDFQQMGGEIYVCQPHNAFQSVLIESNGELSLSGGFIKATGPICDYTGDHDFCYSKSSDGNYYNPHLIPNTDIPWCVQNNHIPTTVCPENSSITVRNGYQITGSSCYCNEGYELNEDKTGCVEPDPCDGDMCCRSLIDMGLTIDTECNNNVCGYSETSVQKDNTFYMHGTTKPWPFIKGNITLDDDVSIPSSCGLTIRGNVTVNSDIELASLDVIEGELLVSENKTLLVETMTSRAKMTVQEGARVEGDILIQNYLVNKGNIKTDDYAGCFVGYYLENSGTMEGCGIGDSTSLPTTTTSQIINTGTLLAETINMDATDRTATIRNEGILQITEDIRVYNGSILNYGEISTSEVYASYFDNLGKTTVLDSMYLGAHQKGISKIVTSASALSVREGSTLSVKNLYADATNTIVGLSGILNVTGNCELGDNSPQAITTGLSIGTNGSMTVEGGLDIRIKSGIALSFAGFTSKGVLKVRGGYDATNSPLFQIATDNGGDFAIKMASGEILTCNGLFSSGNISVSGTASLKNAGSQSIKNWVKNKDGSWEDDYSIYDNTHIVPYGAQIEWCQ